MEFVEKRKKIETAFKTMVLAGEFSLSFSDEKSIDYAIYKQNIANAKELLENIVNCKSESELNEILLIQNSRLQKITEFFKQKPKLN